MMCKNLNIWHVYNSKNNSAASQGLKNNNYLSDVTSRNLHIYTYLMVNSASQLIFRRLTLSCENALFSFHFRFALVVFLHASMLLTLKILKIRVS